MFQNSANLAIVVSNTFAFQSYNSTFSTKLAGISSSYRQKSLKNDLGNKNRPTWERIFSSAVQSFLHENHSGFLFGYSILCWLWMSQQSWFSRWLHIWNCSIRIPGKEEFAAGFLCLVSNYNMKRERNQIILHQISWQFEGAVDEGNRGVSIWDTFVKEPGKFKFDTSKATLICTRYNSS